jgi:hypothetical protein
MKTAEVQEKQWRRDAEGFERVIGELRAAVRTRVGIAADKLDPDAREAVIEAVTHKVFWYFATDLLGAGGIRGYVKKVTDSVVAERQKAGVDQ